MKQPQTSINLPQGDTSPRHNNDARPATPERGAGGRRMWMAWTLMLAGLSLIGAAFCVPPTGVIHSSVLVAFGEILTFTATVMGLDYRFRK